MITRSIEENIQSLLGKGKAIVIMGARQVGKSTLLQQMLGDQKDVVWMNGDELDIQELFREMTSTRIRAILGNNHYLVVDEAQRIKHRSSFETYHRPNSRGAGYCYGKQFV